MNLKLFVPIALLAALVAGCSKGIVVPPAFDLSAKPEDLMKEYTYVVDPEEMSQKKVKKILITDFLLESETSIHRVAKGGQSASAQLHGVSEEALQALTDRVYQDFYKDLTALGYEVIGPEKLSGKPGYQAITGFAESTQPYRHKTETGSSLIFSANRSPLYLPKTDQRGKRTSGDVISIFKNVGSMFKNGGTISMAEQKLADEENAAVLKVWLSTGFGIVAAGSGRDEALAKAFVRGDGDTRLSFRTPDASDSPGMFNDYEKEWAKDGSSMIQLSKPLYSGDNYVSENVGHTRMGLFSDGEFIMTADESKYIAALEKQLAAARKLLIARLKKEIN